LRISGAGAHLFADAPDRLPYRALWLCLVLILYNVAFFLIFRNQTLSAARHELLFIRLQVLFDWVALFLFIHFTAGFQPSFLRILHIIINAMISLRAVLLVYHVSLLGLFCFLHRECFRIFPVTNPGSGKRARSYLPPAYRFVLFSLVLYASTFLAASVMSRFRQRNKWCAASAGT